MGMARYEKGDQVYTEMRSGCGGHGRSQGEGKWAKQREGGMILGEGKCHKVGEEHS